MTLTARCRGQACDVGFCNNDIASRSHTTGTMTAPIHILQLAPSPAGTKRTAERGRGDRTQRRKSVEHRGRGQAGEGSGHASQRVHSATSGRGHAGPWLIQTSAKFTTCGRRGGGAQTASEPARRRKGKRGARQGRRGQGAKTLKEEEKDTQHNAVDKAARGSNAGAALVRGHSSGDSVAEVRGLASLQLRVGWPRLGPPTVGRNQDLGEFDYPLFHLYPGILGWCWGYTRVILKMLLIWYRGWVSCTLDSLRSLWGHLP